MPESPRLLVKKGRIEEAKFSLSALADVPIDAPEISQEIAEIEESLRICGEVSFRDLFKNGPERFFHRACIAASCKRI